MKKAILKILTMCLALVLVFSLVACGGSEKKKTDKETGKLKSEKTNVNGFVFENEESVELGTPDKKLDPKEVYSKITYTADLFHGDYSIKGKDAEKEFANQYGYKTWKNGDDEKEIVLTEVPFRIVAGETMQHSVNYIEGYDWARVYFMNKASEDYINLDYYMCAYTVEGNKIKFKPLDEFNLDQETKKITYSFMEIEFEYEFEFNGRCLTIKSGDAKVDLFNGLSAYKDYDYYYADAYLAPDSESFANIDKIGFRYDGEDKESRIYFETIDEESSYNSIAVFEENGLFTFTLALEESTKTYQMLMFYGDNDGIILTDGEKTYYYTDSYSERNKNALSGYISEDQTEKIEELPESKVEQIVEKKENLVDDLVNAFTEAGIKVSVDEKSGEMAVDSSILFGGDSSVLTDEGKAFLNKFVSVYTSIVFSEKYDGFVSKTLIEGHTAPLATSTYESGLPLSTERAENVKNYCVSSETGVDTTKLATALEAIGCSNSRPILDAEGNVDKAASRRVSFRFIINLEQN